MTSARALTLEQRTPSIPPNARCVAYVRVSTEKQAGEKKVSPETQLEVCRRLATERLLTVDHVIEDHESGAHLERLDRLVAACRAHRLPAGQRGLIVVYDTSRWGRFEDAGDDRMFRQLLKRAGWDVAIGNEPSTGHQAADLFVSTGQAIAASDYRLQLRQRVIDNMPKVAAMGYWQGRAPFGYAVAAAEGKRRKLVQGDERDVATIQRIFQRYVSGKTLQAIADALNAEKAPGPFDQHASATWEWSRPTAQHPDGRRPPCGRWTPSAVRAILACETYTGRLVFKPREVRDERGRILKFARGHVPEQYWVIVEQCHPALIDRRTFDAAARRLADRAKPRKWSASDAPYFLSGLMTCASCGGSVVGGGGTRPGAEDPNALRHYRCRNAQGEHATCVKPMLTVNQRWIEGEVIGRVAAHVRTLVTSGELEKLLDRRLRASTAKGEQARLGRELQELETQRRRVVQKVAEGTITDDDAREVLGGIKGRLAAVGRELEALKAKPTRADHTAERERLLKLAADFATVVKKAPAPVVRELLGYWIDGRITLDKTGRVATMRLRKVPDSMNQGRRAPARPCSHAGSRPSFPG